MPLFDHAKDQTSRVSMYADGAPADTVSQHLPWDGDPAPAPTSGSRVDRVIKTATRIRQFEGWRGYSNRALVAVRQTAAVLLLIGCYAIASWCFSGRNSLRFGAELLLFSVAFIQACAALGTVMYSESRFQIIDQARHFTFGIVALPAAAAALFMKVVIESVGDTAGGDVFTSMLLGNGLPLVYFSIVVIPAFVFAKYVFGGLRSINRKALADEETVAAYMRHDPLQR